MRDTFTETINRLYLQETSLPILTTHLRFMERNMAHFKVYKGTTPIGIVVLYDVDEYAYAHRVYLLPKYRRYFKQVIDDVKTLVKQSGKKGIIIKPNEHTAKLYKKHNIAKEIVWE